LENIVINCPRIYAAGIILTLLIAFLSGNLSSVLSQNLEAAKLPAI
jgi:hypothetical protein